MSQCRQSVRCKRKDQSAAVVVCLMSPPANGRRAFTYLRLQRTDRSRREAKIDQNESLKMGIIRAREQKRNWGYIECNEKVAIPCKLNRCAQSKLFCWLGGPFELERWKIQRPGAAAARGSKQCVNDSISGVVAGPWSLLQHNNNNRQKCSNIPLQRNCKWLLRW